jgi:apolipoprotein N-acyltransferase
VHLVPFGEFIPTGFRWFTNLMNIPLGDFSRGPLDALSLQAGAQRAAPNICYEDLFGEELAVRFRDPARAPTVLVNLSNIGWFGDTIALPQHLNISRMRSLELQRPMLRATNTGVTAIIDHRGRVTHRLEPFVRGALEGSYEGRIGTTPFAWWAGRWGLWPLFGLALGVLALAAAAKRGLRLPKRGPDLP